MSSLVHSPILTGNSVFELESDSENHRRITSFRFIPPERVGLTGEYDHSGLAKRVCQALHKTFLSQELERLKITQRGRVVVLSGYALNASLLQQFVNIAATTSGANAVETLGVKLVERSR